MTWGANVPRSMRLVEFRHLTLCKSSRRREEMACAEIHAYMRWGYTENFDVVASGPAPEVSHRLPNKTPPQKGEHSPVLRCDLLGNIMLVGRNASRSTAENSASGWPGALWLYRSQSQPNKL